MKLLKWLAIIVVALVLVLGIGIGALVYLVDWNDQKERIQGLVKTHTGRDLVIAGDLDPSVFPWAGISIGEISLSNADGFGDLPFAKMGSADVKVELLPLLRRTVNIRTVELSGLELDLQRNAEGITNWDDLIATTSTRTTTEEEAGDAEVTTEVEGNTATIAALAVGGIDISNATVRWTDAQAGLDAQLSDFDLKTGTIELAKPFSLETNFSVASNSLDLAADIDGSGEVMIDLESQTYSLSGFTLNTDAKGPSFPGGALEASLGANVVAALGEQSVSVDELTLNALGMALKGQVDVTGLDAEPTVVGNLASDEFSPREMFEMLGIEAPVTADEAALTRASLGLSFTATPASVAMTDIAIALDDTNLTGTASVPSLEGAVPPLRFDLALDAINLDRYLPPKAEGEAEERAEEGGDAPAAEPSDPDAPIVLPTEMLQALDVDGTFTAGELIVSNLSTTDIVIPVKASGGKVGVDGVTASLYQGAISATANLDVSGGTPRYAAAADLADIQAEPLLGDLLQKDSFLSGGGNFGLDITTSGDTVNALKAGLDGNFSSAFTDGSINGINLGYQLRRAKAALTLQTLSADEAEAKTDFSSLSVSGVFDNGVMTSNDLDMRAPLLRLDGAGTVALPAEKIDYVLGLLVTGTIEGQGGDDAEDLSGLDLDVGIDATFTELAEDPVKVLLSGLSSSYTSALQGNAKAAAEAKAEALKAEAQEALDAKEAELKEKLESELEGVIDEETQDKLKEGLKGLLNR
jgi:AsmA protein